MSRLNKERQKTLEPERLNFAKNKILDLGIEITYQDSTSIHFIFKNSLVLFFPYSGWFTGKSVQDGRGLNNLLKQLNDRESIKDR